MPCDELLCFLCRSFFMHYTEVESAKRYGTCKSLACRPTDRPTDSLWLHRCSALYKRRRQAFALLLKSALDSMLRTRSMRLYDYNWKGALTVNCSSTSCGQNFTSFWNARNKTSDSCRRVHGTANRKRWSIMVLPKPTHWSTELHSVIEMNHTSV